MFGTANPTNAIGPQNAVISPVKTAVTPIHVKRIILILRPSIEEAFTPNTSVFNGLIRKTLNSIPIINTMTINGSCLNSTCWSDPSVHIVNDFNSSAALLVCNIEIIELVKLPSINPINNNEICERTNVEKPIMISPKINAPIKALLIMPKSFVKNGIPVINEQATNKLEPVLIPKT